MEPPPAAMEPPNVEPASEWSGVVFMGRRRIVFAGTGGTAKNQRVHALKICIALAGDFKLSIKSGIRDKSCSAVIINAGVKHTIQCSEGNRIFLAYILPETQAGRDIRAEYLYDNRGKFYDIPRELIEETMPWQQILQDYEGWDCRDAFKASDDIITALGRIRRRQISTSLDLSHDLSDSVSSTIRHLYKEAENLKPVGKPDETKFDPSQFRRETGTSIETLFTDIQTLNALRLYADEVQANEKGSPEERRLVDKLDDPALPEKEKAKIRRQLNAIPHRVLIQHIARLLGISPALFNFRNTTRLGLSFRDLRNHTVFHSCPEK